jgi:glycosyltransferase involved in cell wall biosynthesis
MMQPKISILMALRNGIEFLDDSVGSVWNQTYQDWELLIGVNGHEPQSEVWYLANLERNVNVKVFDLPDCKNKPQALNRMTKDAIGDYIAILDVDDKWHRDKLAQQVQEMSSNDCDVLGTQAEYFGDSEGSVSIAVGSITFDMLLECNHLVNSSVLMRPECAVWDDTDSLDDYMLWLRLAHEGRKLWNMPSLLTYIRSHVGQWFAPRGGDAEAIREHWRQV